MTRVLLLIVPFVLAAPAVAQADTPVQGVSGATSPGVVVVFGRGEQVFEVGPLPELGKKAKKKAMRKKRKKGKAGKKKVRDAYKGSWLQGYRAGIRCKVFLLFWSYVHRWKCEPVVARKQVVLRPTSKYQEKKLAALKKAIGEKYKLSDHKLSWWALNGRWVVGGILLLLIISGVIKRLKRRRGY